MAAEGFLNQISVFGRVYDLTPTYDAELDENSENAVQNKIITGEINDLDERMDQTTQSLQETMGELNETKETLSSLTDEVSKFIPIEDDEIDDLFGL